MRRLLTRNPESSVTGSALTCSGFDFLLLASGTTLVTPFCFVIDRVATILAALLQFGISIWRQRVSSSQRRIFIRLFRVE